MARRSRKAAPRAPVYDHAGDFGPVVWDPTEGVRGGAAEIVIASRPDPDRPGGHVVLGARRRDTLSELEARGTISKRQRDAASRLLDDCSLASGGGLVANMSGVFIPSGPRSGLPEAQVAAIGRVHRVFRLLGLHDGTVTWWIVFGNRTLAEWDARWQRREGTGARLLKEALTALDEHYNGKAR